MNHLLSIACDNTSNFFINPHDALPPNPNTQIFPEANLPLHRSSSEAHTASQSTEPNNKSQEVFLIVRSLKNKEGYQKGYPLEVGNILKLGRLEFRVVEARKENGPIVYADAPKIIDFLPPLSIRKEKDVHSCRLCLEEEEATNDGSYDHILISPCKCKGTCQYIHLVCLQSWFRSRLVMKPVNNALSYQWKNAGCEVCQEPIPRRFYVKDILVDLFELNTTFPEPYLIIESIAKDKKNGYYLHVLKMKKEDNFKLGRGHQCDVRIGDISVSRFHALIKYENDKFLVVDNNSKFGTLVLMNEQFPISEEKIAVQVGRTVITFVMKPIIPASNLNALPNQKAQIKPGQKNTMGTLSSPMKGENRPDQMENESGNKKNRMIPEGQIPVPAFSLEEGQRDINGHKGVNGNHHNHNVGTGMEEEVGPPGCYNEQVAQQIPQGNEMIEEDSIMVPEENEENNNGPHQHLAGDDQPPHDEEI